MRWAGCGHRRACLGGRFARACLPCARATGVAAHALCLAASLLGPTSAAAATAAATAAAAAAAASGSRHGVSHLSTWTFLADARRVHAASWTIVAQDDPSHLVAGRPQQGGKKAAAAAAGEAVLDLTDENFEEVSAQNQRDGAQPLS